MRPDRQKLFLTLQMTYGVSHARYAELRADLEPIFGLADEADWPEATGCGSAGVKRGARDPTQMLRLEDPSVMDASPQVRDLTDPAAAVEVGERYHDVVCETLGYGRLVELGSVLGAALLDPLFRKIGYVQPKAYVLLQILALYRTAAAVAGLETESSMLGLRIRRYFLDAARWEAQNRDIEYEALLLAEN